LHNNNNIPLKKKHVIIITGPTAVGKTAFTLEFAEKYGLEIMSCDSRQFYKEMSIGTAKPSAQELARVKHYFVNSLSITQDYSAGDFEREGLKFLDHYFKSKDSIILSGGSGLYIKALCEGFDHFPDVPKHVFDEVSDWSLEQLQSELAVKDPEYHSNVDLANKHRLIRAVSVIKVSGQKFSSFQNKINVKRPFKTTYLVLNRERAELYERINRRVDLMISGGLVEEAKELFNLKHLNALQTVGYQELFDHFEGKISFDEAVELIKRNSRRYAKRQLTWFRKIKSAKWIHPDEDIDLNVL
jgi:tRNA dimethylallyltransferase